MPSTVTWEGGTQIECNIKLGNGSRNNNKKKEREAERRVGTVKYQRQG